MKLRLNRNALVALFAATLMCGASEASAQVYAYNNLEDVYVFSNNGRQLRGADWNPGVPSWTVGYDFIAEESGGVSRVMLGLVELSATPQSYTIQIHEDDGGVPGSVLGDWQTSAGAAADMPSVIEADGSVQISEGETYWIVAVPGAETRGQWRDTTREDWGIRAVSEAEGPWQLASARRGAFQIEVGTDAIAYSNFFVGGFSGLGLSVSGTVGGTRNGFTPGSGFEAEASGAIKEIVLPLRLLSGPPNFDIELRSDDNGEPGNIIGSWNTMAADSADRLPIVVEADGSVEVQAGEFYWFICRAGSDDTVGNWNQNSIGDSGTRALSVNNGPWQISTANLGAFRILLESEAPCIADWNGDGEVDINDFFAYLGDFEDGDPRADLNNDGEIDINDFFIFLSEFEAGC